MELNYKKELQDCERILIFWKLVTTTTIYIGMVFLSVLKYSLLIIDWARINLGIALIQYKTIFNP